jgi:tetratricopeptide (TPR) repeat protein
MNKLIFSLLAVVILSNISYSQPKDSIYYKQFTEAYKIDSMQKAISYINKAIEVNPKEPWYYYVKGRCYWKMDKYSEAIKALDKAHDLDPSESSLIETRGNIKEDWGNY